MKIIGKNWLKLGLISSLGLTMFFALSLIASAAAPTGFTSQVFQDSDANGTIDQVVIVINGGEALTACVVTDAEVGTDWTYVANDLTGSTLAAAGDTHTCDTGTATVTLKITGAPANTTSATTLPTIAYDNDDTDNSIANATGNLGVVVAANITDDASPIITLAQTQDTDNNGKVDALKVTFSENLDDSTINGYLADANYTPATLALANVTDEAIVGLNATETALGDAEDDNVLYITFTENAGACSSADQTGCDTELTNQDLTLTGASATIDDLAAADNDLGNVITATIVETDLAKPVLMKVVAGTSSGANTIAFTFSEAITAANGASSATKGDLTSVGTFAGLGNFGTNGNIVVATTKNTVAGSGTDTITVTLAGQSGAWMESSDDVAALTVPSGTIGADATAGVVDAASNQANTSGAAVTATTLPSAAPWDVTPPTISSAVLSDTYLSDSAFIAGGTFNSGQDGKADQIIFTVAEAIKGSSEFADAAGTRNDWALTGVVNEFGNSMTVIKAVPVTSANTGTTYTVNFSGATTYYDNPSTFHIINTQDAAPSLIDRAGNPLAGDATVTMGTYRTCFTGLTCSGSSIGNVAVITNSITQPAAGGNDATGPAAPTGFAVTLNENLKPVLTWTDPTDTDFNTIQILKSKGDGVTPTIALNTAAKGVKTYTDSSAVLGEVLNYILKPFDLSGNAGTATSAVSVTVEEPAVEPEPVEGTLSIQNESGQSGTFTLTEADGQTTVTLALTGNPEAVEGVAVEQPAHIHMGSCAELGDAKYTLTNVVDGASVTVLDMTIEALKAELPLALNVHKSAEEPSVYYACGDILPVAAEETTEAAEEEVAEEETGDEAAEEEPTAEEVGEPTPVPPASGEFPDTVKHWAKAEIAAMTKAGIIKGNADGKFKPDNNINRAEVAILLCRISGDDEEKASKNPFGDVKAGAWYGGCVSALKTAGIIKGNPDGTFKPTSDINRAEFLTLALRLYVELVGEVEVVTTTTAYTDLKTDWYTETVATATKLGFIQGSTCGTGKCFYAEKPISRAEAATILYRMFKSLF